MTYGKFIGESMIDKDILAKIKKINIFTKRLMKSSLVGDYLTAFKGSGLEFHQIREYNYGDDIRFIDWNSSAKSGKIMLKQFIEERDRTIILAVDISSSTFFSSKSELKKDLIANLAATLAFIANNNKDRIGALFFSDKVEKWIAPNRGNLNLGKIIETIFTIKPKNNKTNLKEALNFLISLKKKNSVLFFISDWIDDLDNYKKILKVVSCEYDLVVVRVLDNCEDNIFNLGLLDLQDIESDSNLIIDTDSKNINLNLQERLLEQKKVFDSYKIDLLNLRAGYPFINPLVNFFRQRIRKQI